MFFFQKWTRTMYQKYGKLIYSPPKRTVAALWAVSPSPLRTRHWYVPQSARLTDTSLKTSLCALPAITLPSLYQVMECGPSFEEDVMHLSSVCPFRLTVDIAGMIYGKNTKKKSKNKIINLNVSTVIGPQKS